MMFYAKKLYFFISHSFHWGKYLVLSHTLTELWHQTCFVVLASCTVASYVLSPCIILCWDCFCVIINSMLVEMRCQIHSELAVIEEEEGRLEDSLTHLQKAMLLDNGTQRESLTLAFRLLKLRQTLYQTPSRAEDKAAMLMQQVLSTSVLVWQVKTQWFLKAAQGKIIMLKQNKQHCNVACYNEATLQCNYCTMRFKLLTFFWMCEAPPGISECGCLENKL